MAKEKFIKEAAVYVKKYAPQFGIKVHSPIIAQLVLESDGGESELAVNAHNYGGLKYREGRCPSASGAYYKVGSEQNADGSYTSSNMKWFKFPNMESGIKGYFEFINTSNYSKLKGVTDPRTYLELIKAAGYATSLKYVDNLMNVIEKYKLTQYDTAKEMDKMVINVHAGHNPDGKVACGAIGYIKESTEARRVKDEVIRMLRKMGHTVYDCTCEDGSSSSDVLKKIVSKCNAHDVDLDVSIHFNAAGNLPEDGKTTGTEVLLHSGYSKAGDYAVAVSEEIEKLGFKNRGIKFRPDLYFLKKTKAPAMLIECCFVNDKDDSKLYDHYNMAKAIVKGITGTNFEEEEEEEVVETPNKEDEKLYHVALKRSDAEKVKETLRELEIDAVIVET